METWLLSKAKLRLKPKQRESNAEMLKQSTGVLQSHGEKRKSSSVSQEKAKQALSSG